MSACLKHWLFVYIFSPFEMGEELFSERDDSINGIYADNPIHYFQKDPHVKLVVVANKLNTGFDFPSLTYLYIDKVLRGSIAVQTISRLNRYHREKNEVYIIDFINSYSTIGQAFARYWKGSKFSKIILSNLKG